MDLETLYDAWERYKDLRRRCPHHGLPLWLQVQTFYNGVNPSTRQMIDAAAGGTINNKTPEATYEFIKEMSLNNYQWQVMRTKQTKTGGVYNVDAVNMLSNQMEILNKKIDGLLGSMQVHPVIRCDSSGGWRNHPNISWGGQGNQRPQNPQGFQQLPYQQEKKPNLEEMLSKFISVSETHFQNTETALNNQQAEQLNAINVQGEKGLVEPESESKQGIVNKLPNKLKDPGSFTIPCLIGSLDVNNALADLGASTNVMRYKMFKQLGLGNPKETRMSIQLADKTIRFPKGIIEYVLVKIDKFIFPIDFIVLDIEEDSNTPLILGRTFLATARTIIDVGTCELTLRVETKQSPFNLEMSSKDIHYPCSSNNRDLFMKNEGYNRGAR
ncbi:hypothetical protein CXB51_021870 [Gossypium anomalum]|uniref:Retrotransposon gag domain-containing protein n=1 Tax=Gossypium anomalum TaxID=47600 RepID=A0A8J5YGL0_9ROSI|nr:hypothetical protein CXB51_021870 [Gossypium anomalum]